jgi:hypothetical protein
MQKHVLVLTTSAFMLAYGAIAASAQEPMPPPPDQLQTQQQPMGQEGRGMMGQGGMMGRGMMGQGGMVGGGMKGPPVMMRIIFSLMDSDGDGTISLQEFQAAHERIFKAMDSASASRSTDICRPSSDPGPFASVLNGATHRPRARLGGGRRLSSMESNKDGRLTLEEMEAFMQGTRTAVPRQ